MEEKVQKIASKISAQPHLLALRDGMASALPLIIIGSVFMLIANFPAEIVTNWLDSFGIVDSFNNASDATFGIVGLAVTFTVAFMLAKGYKVDSLSAGLISTASYVLVTPLVTSEAGSGFPTQYLGTAGMFVGIIVALVSTEIFRLLVQQEITIKMPDTVPPNVSRAFSAIIPGFAVIFIWTATLMLLNSLGVDNIHQLVADLIATPLSKVTGTLPGIIVVILLQCFFWFFGIHGAQITGPIIEPLLFAASDQNRVALQAGKELPNIITYEFLYNFVFPGGAGAIIALAILLFIASRSEANKTLGKLSIVPVSFQIAEPVIFGFPTVLNPSIVIPFVAAPVINAIIIYFAMDLGWVAKPIGAVVPWTTPPVIAGFLATGGRISGAVMNIITIMISMAIYYPFFRADDKLKLNQEMSEH
ncbi:PTS system, cellobiose-specific IIC component [Atopostipes suicloacalis DSM 15692]|uniref:Permease IIC component n=1 Tax=Atopostipes suicloacalis DSM 15692 TaxID=1121025 RepID=A0A1M4XG80_9LACT|nr:PTS sugar transporter subunit IIC [Atopostipes suicloacalis]SHE92336.1 PTS system, cellobiose-specific IIC component [Atopostipes suicloacalis DSM 15692]